MSRQIGIYLAGLSRRIGNYLAGLSRQIAFPLKIYFKTCDERTFRRLTYTITNTNVSLSILDLFVLPSTRCFLEYWLIDECWLIDWWIINWFPWWASWIWNFQLLSKDSPHALQAKHDRILRVSAEFPKRAGLLSFQVQSSYKMT